MRPLPIPRDDERYLDTYLQVVIAARSWNHNDPLRLLSATKLPPTTRQPGSILLPVRLWVPDSAFDSAPLEMDVPLRNIRATYQ